MLHHKRSTPTLPDWKLQKKNKMVFGVVTKLRLLGRLEGNLLGVADLAVHVGATADSAAVNGAGDAVAALHVQLWQREASVVDGGALRDVSGRGLVKHVAHNEAANSLVLGGQATAVEAVHWRRAPARLGWLRPSVVAALGGHLLLRPLTIRRVSERSERKKKKSQLPVVTKANKKERLWHIYLRGISSFLSRRRLCVCVNSLLLSRSLVDCNKSMDVGGISEEEQKKKKSFWRYCFHENSCVQKHIYPEQKSLHSRERARHRRRC